MSEKTTDGSAVEPKSGAQDPIEASGSEDQKKEDTVAYSTYSRVLSEKKRDAAEKAEWKAKAEQYEKDKLEAQGKWQEIAESERKAKEAAISDKREFEAQVAEERIRSQVELRAKDLGCVDTELLIKAMDVKGLDVVDGYKVSSQSLEMVLQQVKQDKPYLFSKPAPSIQDGVPVTSEYNGKVDLSKMTTEQIIAAARKSAKL